MKKWVMKGLRRSEGEEEEEEMWAEGCVQETGLQWVRRRKGCVEGRVRVSFEMVLE